ncbi:hypothetical protein ORI89_10205 [Sphingobacterium sp. UT-1RO-CII-1]|uniref:hypothetical protein n=1 Tax=Sphingobacterium sp. UT-1RO-CII-1 TaxID=2995225 RepID=UPI00227CE521|nr:hypothetical protein [Sphingobacterium sp. UT-1RO-CII-1]MCY4780023.1 hypothetical protein [Sphingobacterium sp. UT-1RO-CII-1]
MKKLIKLVPAMALLLALGVYTGKVIGKSQKVETNHMLTDVQWLYTPPATDDDPTNENYYTYHPSSDLESDCTGSNEVCGISAPSQGANPSTSKPDLSDLSIDLGQGNNNPKIFRGDFTR